MITKGFSFLGKLQGCVVLCLLRDCEVKQINYMYAQYVKNTMQPLNISDVTKDQRFPWTVSMSFLCLIFSFSQSDKLSYLCSDSGITQITPATR